MTSKLTGPIIGGLVALALFVGSLHWHQLFLNELVVFFQYLPWLWVGTIVLGLVALIGYFLDKPLATGMVVGAGILWGVYLIFSREHAIDKATYEASVVIDETEEVGPYDVRTPYVVGKEQIVGNVTTNGDPTGETKYIPSEDVFTHAVQRRGMFVGYGEAVSLSPQSNGQASNANCFFTEEADRRLGGPLTNNLSRMVLDHSGYGSVIRDSNVYVYCDDDTPKVVVPVTKYKGFWAPIEVPHGVAVYDGHTGEMSWYTEVAPGEIPGPVYPISLAEKAVESTHAMGGFLDWAFNRIGYANTSDGGDNLSNFNLHKTDTDEDHFVSPLVMQGRSDAIVATGFVTSNSMKSGELNPYTVVPTEKSRQSNSATEDRIRADYGSLEWASGMKVFEITPIANDTWVATLGREKAVMYTVTIDADLKTCLYSVSGKELKCSGDQEDPEEITGPLEPNGGDYGPLEVMSEQELIELQKQITSEIESRLTD